MKYVIVDSTSRLPRSNYIPLLKLICVRHIPPKIGSRHFVKVQSALIRSIRVVRRRHEAGKATSSYGSLAIRIRRSCRGTNFDLQIATQKIVTKWTMVGLL